MNFLNRSLFLVFAFFVYGVQSQNLIDFVNPFIGTTNYGTTNPGPIVPNGMMSVSPFNVMGSEKNKFDKDNQWWSTPYSYDNSFFTGYSHVNLSGVGCPEVGSLLLMPTSGELNVNYTEYGSEYSDEQARPGYYSNILTKYGIKTEVTATTRSSIARFTFPKGKANVLMNLGQGLTNEVGGYLKKVNATEIEGMRMQGTFCYNSQAVFPIYFVMRLSEVPKESGYWKQQPEMPVKGQWDNTAGTRKLYTKYNKEIMGDDIGAYFSYDLEEEAEIEVQIGISFVSIENARENLEAEQNGFDFEKVRKEAEKEWEATLSKIKVKGGDDDQKTVFYTGLYHSLIHPNILNDVNGEYPAMESDEILKTDTRRYTVFSLWDTYRAVHQFLTLMYPDKQLDMVRSMVDMYKEGGWLPKWELYSRETLTMDGDPSFPVIVDTYRKGLTDFDIDTAYEAMIKSATTPGKDNFIRPDNDDYWELGYVPLRSEFDNSTAQGLEYYIADNVLSKLADLLGKKEDAKKFYKQSLNYKKYYSPEYGMIRPRLPNGDFITPFDPKQGEDFEDVPGFHEGSSWSYSFMIPHDIKGMIKMHGGEKRFVEKLQQVFDEDHYDPTNEPNIDYAYLFSYVKGEAWRTQKLTQELVKKYFKNTPDGLPGNDDTGTMSTWAMFGMMGFYPDNATETYYTLTSPMFDEIELELDEGYYGNSKLTIEVIRPKDEAQLIDRIEVDGNPLNGYRIEHKDLVKAKKLKFYMK